MVTGLHVHYCQSGAFKNYRSGGSPERTGTDIALTSGGYVIAAEKVFQHPVAGAHHTFQEAFQDSLGLTLLWQRVAMSSKRRESVAVSSGRSPHLLREVSSLTQGGQQPAATR